MKVLIISWKRLIAYFLILIIAVSFVTRRLSLEYTVTIFQADEQCKTYFSPNKPAQCSLEEMYQDVFMTLLLPYINEAVTNYYKSRTALVPGVDPWQPKILCIERPDGYRTFLFNIKLEVLPYLGAHNSIGVDHITLMISPGEVKVINFEHIQDFPIPPWLR